jgi:hypothetical protein
MILMEVLQRGYQRFKLHFSLRLNDNKERCLVTFPYIQSDFVSTVRNSNIFCPLFRSTRRNRSS